MASTAARRGRQGLGDDAAARRIALAVPHTTILPAILPGTDLIAAVPEDCIGALCANELLTWAKLPIAVEVNQIYQWWHKRQDHDPAHRWLRDLFATLASQSMRLPP